MSKNAFVVLLVAVVVVLSSVGVESRRRHPYAVVQSHLAVGGRVDFVTQKILKIIEKLRGEMKNGFPEADIPPLDPLTLPLVDLAPLTLAHMGKLDVATFSSVTVKDLPSFVVDGVKASMLKMDATINLSLPLTTVDGQYKINGKFLGLVPVFGEGAFHVDVRDVKIEAYSQLAAKDGVFLLESLKLEATVGGIDLHLDGLMGGGNLGEQLNGLVQTVANRLVNNLTPDVVHDLTEFSRLKLNEIIKHLDIL